jgi:ABC-2 type transport system permease protein
VNAFWSMTLANMKMTLRNRTALFWLMAFPFIFIFLFGFLFAEGDFEIRVGVAGHDTSELAAAVVAQMEQTPGFVVHRGEPDAELAALDDGDRRVVVIFSPGVGESPARAEIIADRSNPNVSQVAVMAIEQFLLEAELAITQQPRLIETSFDAVEGEQFRYIDFLVPGILAMSIMTNGIIGLSSTFVTYRERGILRRIKATPFPLWAFIMSKISTQVVIAVAQSAILLTAAVLLFQIEVAPTYLSLVAMVALGALAFLAIGFAVSAFARNREIADSASNAIAFPMMFLGGVFFPVDAAPGWLRPFTEIMPLTYLATALRAIILDGSTLMDVWTQALVLVVTALAGLVVAVRFFRWESRVV